MKTPKEEEAKAAPLMKWQVKKTPAGENTLKIGAVRAGVGGIVNLTQEQADALNKALPDCLQMIGI